MLQIAHYLNFFFQCGSLISIYGVFLCNRKRTQGLYAQLNENGMEEGQHVPLLSGKPSNLIGGNIVSYSKDQSLSSTAVNIWSYTFEVLFQVNFLCNLFFSWKNRFSILFVSQSTLPTLFFCFLQTDQCRGSSTHWLHLLVCHIPISYHQRLQFKLCKYRGFKQNV